MSNKERFIELLRSTGRAGVDNVISNLDDLGFFEAPASTVFHLNTPGGLLQHSLNVYDEAVVLAKGQAEFRPEMAEKLKDDSLIIAALLHDVCKAEIYKEALKWRKDAGNKWESYTSYEAVYSEFPMGHGEKSVILLPCNGLSLYDDEMLAIRWHMTAWDLAFQNPEARNNINTARNKYPLCSLVNLADGIAANLLEWGTNAQEEL